MNELQERKRALLLEVVQKGVTKLLDEAKVPQREHLKVIAALAERVNAHKKDMQSHQDYLLRHEAVLKNHERQMREWENTSRHLTSIESLKGEKGDSIKGEQGENGTSVDADVLVEHILSLIPKPKDGDHGKDAVVDEESIIKGVIKRIQKEKSLDLSHIKGAQTFIKNGVQYKIEELMHGAGSSSGGTFSVLIPTSGVINGINTVFTFASAPSVIVLDNGNAMNRVSADGTVNWTISGTTVTLSQAPNFNLYAF